MSLVEMLAVPCIQHLHCLRKVGFRCLDNDVEVVGHQAVSVDLDMVLLHDLGQDIKPDEEIAVIQKDVGATVSPRSNVVKGALKLDA